MTTQAAKSPSVVALIPARAGSERVPNKNIRSLNGHPLIAYSIVSAVQSGVFDAVVVSTDSDRYAAIAGHYGAEVPFLRPTEMAGATSPDIEWVQHALGELARTGREFDCFAILRPTSPFRRADTIRRAWTAFVDDAGADSLRAVEKCSEHPGKMWVVRQNRLLPILPYELDGTPWHSNQYKALPEVYVQNASLEIAWSRIAMAGTIAGATVLPFISEGHEGVDVNTSLDWLIAEHFVHNDPSILPPIDQKPYFAAD